MIRPEKLMAYSLEKKNRHLDCRWDELSRRVQDKDIEDLDVYAIKNDTCNK